MNSLTPYLFFNGRCDEALAFYQQATGAELLQRLRFRDNPEQSAHPLPAGWTDKVMHAALQIGKTRLFASDGMGGEPATFKGFSVVLNLPDEDGARRAFEALAAGGTVSMPMTRTFWSPAFGMLTDRFGVGWMVGVEVPVNATDGERDLVLERVLDAPREKLFRAWTEPALMVQWFTPPPFVTTHAEVDLRPGGSCLVVMRSPEGQEFPNRGVYLEVVPNERLVTTDAYVSAWEPAPKPFMTLTLTFEDAGPGRTKYTARARHWSAEDRAAHEQMGFHEGWGQATRQLEALAARL